MIKPFLAAIQFLTVCPLPSALKTDERDIARSSAYFPVVGLAVGAAAAGLDGALTHVLPLPAASVLTVIFLLAVSGALHMDGLADTADGFFSARPRERILDIMRDSRTGPMGVMTIVCVLLLKVALLSCLPESTRWRVLLLTPFAGRLALLVQMALLSYARPQGGLASTFYAGRSRFHWAWVPAAVGAGFAAGGWAGLWAMLAAFIFSLLFAGYVRRKIGGATGDTLGAACELTELTPALVCVMWAHQGMGMA